MNLKLIVIKCILKINYFDFYYFCTRGRKLSSALLRLSLVTTKGIKEIGKME